MTEHLRRALVTGASSGIGWAIAERLVTDGWQVVGISRTGRVPEGALGVSADLAGDGVRKAVAQAQNLLGGVDAITFTAGIGENSAFTRREICAKLTGIGVVLDEELNGRRDKAPHLISAPESRVKVLVVRTNEELAMAQQAAGLLAG